MIINKYSSEQKLGLVSFTKLEQLARYIEKHPTKKQVFVFDYLVDANNPMSWYVVSDILAITKDTLVVITAAEFDDEPMTLRLVVKPNNRSKAAFVCRLLKDHTPIRG